MPAVGTTKNIVICIPSTPVTAFSKAPCDVVATKGWTPSVVNGYVIDASAASAIDSIAGPVDYASLGGLWGFSFTSTLILWMLAKKAGIVVNAVRRF